MVIDTSPEVYNEQFRKSMSGNRRCGVTSKGLLQKTKLWRGKKFVWFGIAIVVFGLGVSAGIIVAWIASRKGQSDSA